MSLLTKDSKKIIQSMIEEHLKVCVGIYKAAAEAAGQSHNCYCDPMTREYERVCLSLKEIIHSGDCDTFDYLEEMLRRKLIGHKLYIETCFAAYDAAEAVKVKTCPNHATRQLLKDVGATMIPTDALGKLFEQIMGPPEGARDDENEA